MLYVIVFMVTVGAFATYLEPWHADVFEWLDLRKNHGKVDYLMIVVGVTFFFVYPFMF